MVDLPKPIISGFVKYVKFGLLGICNNLLGFGFYFGFLKLGFSYPIASLISSAIMFWISFKALGHLVFSNPDPRRIGRYLSLYIVSYLGTIGLIAFLKTWGVSEEWGGLIAIFSVATLNFLANQYYVFKSDPS